jgi:hypothetical protein
MACSLFAPRFLFYFRRCVPCSPAPAQIFHWLYLGSWTPRSLAIEQQFYWIWPFTVWKVRQLEFLFEAASTESRPIRSSIEPLFVEWTD